MDITAKIFVSDFNIFSSLLLTANMGVSSDTLELTAYTWPKEYSL